MTTFHSAAGALAGLDTWKRTWGTEALGRLVISIRTKSEGGAAADAHIKLSGPWDEYRRVLLGYCREFDVVRWTFDNEDAPTMTYFAAPEETPPDEAAVAALAALADSPPAPAPAPARPPPRKLANRWHRHLYNKLQGKYGEDPSNECDYDCYWCCKEWWAWLDDDEDVAPEPSFPCPHGD